MAKEILAIPEENLAEVIAIIRAGLLVQPDVSEEVRAQLNKWCNEMEGYVLRMRQRNVHTT